MIFREAKLSDIKQIQLVRNSVKENMLSNPALVTDEDCKLYMTIRGKAWVCEIDTAIVGFAYADLLGNNIWALFIHPGYERKSIGKVLHRLMLDWYFGKTQQTVWLSTAPGTRAEIFYEKQGWIKTGMAGKEIKFEMSYANWQSRHLAAEHFL